MRTLHSLDNTAPIANLVRLIPGNLHLPCPICLVYFDHIATPRHVASWNDLTASEQFGLLARLSEALAVGAKGFVASEEHGHFHLRLTTATAPRLTTGGTDPLLPLITRDIDAAEQVDLAVAFAMTSGVALIEPWLRDLLGRGVRLRIVVRDYMDVTDPAALQRLTDLEGALLYVHQTRRGSFHPKAWLFRAPHQQLRLRRLLAQSDVYRGRLRGFGFISKVILSDSASLLILAEGGREADRPRFVFQQFVGQAMGPQDTLPAP